MPSCNSVWISPDPTVWRQGGPGREERDQADNGLDPSMEYSGGWVLVTAALLTELGPLTFWPQRTAVGRTCHPGPHGTPWNPETPPHTSLAGGVLEIRVQSNVHTCEVRLGRGLVLPQGQGAQLETGCYTTLPSRQAPSPLALGPEPVRSVAGTQVLCPAGLVLEFGESWASFAH